MAFCRDLIPPYICPVDGVPLCCERLSDGREQYRSTRGRIYPVRAGIPDFTFPEVLGESDAAARKSYDAQPEVYDRNVSLVFAMCGADPASVLNAQVDRLQLTPSSRVLETGAGTGLVTGPLAERLGPQGVLCFQDLSPNMLAVGISKLRDKDGPALAAHIGNASYLPFPDDSFDAYFHGGGINTFSEIERAFSEAARVTRPGGRVVIIDESMPIWLRNTEYARILCHSNPLMAAPVPYQHIPVCAREVSVHWILGEVFYAIAFTVGEGPPVGNFDLPIAGARGGTMRTRYEGMLEGVTPQAKAMAQAARAKRGLSMHRWLDQVVREAAARDLDESTVSAPGEDCGK